METQERLLECPFCGTVNPTEAARWNDEESSYEVICQSCGKTRMEKHRDDRKRRLEHPQVGRLTLKA